MTLQDRSPIFRGVLHLNMAVILPFVTYVLNAVVNTRQQHYLWLIFCMTEFQLIASATLHTAYDNIWWAEVIDHSAIFVSGYLLHVVLEYYNPVVLKPVCGVVAVMAILQKIIFRDTKFNRLDKLCIVAEGLLYMYSIITLEFPTEHARGMAFLTLLLCILMLATYHFKWPKRYNSVYGYHELMHIFSAVIILYNYLAVLMHP